ncbi:MAG TPA: hypothetical protein VHV83_05550 [Armatimonadota bacterium]|nr:hypothetical protein [Armatimonadota bacterium]
MSEKREFTPADYTIDLKGKDYLPVAARVKWFRTVFPNGTIETEEVCVDLDRPFTKGSSKVYGYARFRATVRDADGRILGQGTKTENAANFFDFVEKAETGAIGRALAASGFGTELDQDLDEGRVVDAPRERKRPLATHAPHAGTNSGPRMASQRPTGPTMLQPDILEWLDQQAKRAGFENIKAACDALEYPVESVLTIEAMQRSLDKELKQRIAENAKAS